MPTEGGGARPARQVIMIGPSPRARGGMATVVQTLLEHGYEDDGRCRFIASHVDGSPLAKAARAAGALAEFASLLLRGKVALLHVHVASGVSFWRKAAFMALAYARGCPVIFHLHAGQFRQFIDGLSPARRRHALALIGKARAGFALTQASADWMRDTCHLKQVEIFPNPIAITPVDPATIRAGRGHEIVFLGRLEEKKGVFDLVRAFAVVHAELPQTQLVLGGDGDAAGVMALAKKLQIENFVKCLGWVGPDEKPALLKRAAVFVLPSHFEQMPMTILEALSFGTPVVGTNVGAVADMLAHGNSGSVVPPKEIAVLAASILRIMTDNIRTDMMAVRGLERVKSEYMVETVIHRLRRRYEELAHEEIS